MLSNSFTFKKGISFSMWCVALLALVVVASDE